MEEKNKSGPNPVGCFLLLVGGTIVLLLVVPGLKLSGAAERQAVSAITAPLAAIAAFIVLLLIAAAFRR